jgi:O-succinylbenzoate synthase
VYAVSSRPVAKTECVDAGRALKMARAKRTRGMDGLLLCLDARKHRAPGRAPIAPAPQCAAETLDNATHLV